MRIVHLGKYFAPERGGMESFVHDLALTQAEAGHEVTVLVHTAAAPDDFCLHPRLRVIRRASTFSLGRYAPVSLSLPLALNALLAEKPHVLHVHSPNAAALWPACLPWLKTPLVTHWHADVDFPRGFGPPRPLLWGWRQVERLLLRKSAAIIATSQSYLEASPWLRPYATKCRVIPLGLRAQRTPPAANHAARFLLEKDTEEIALLALGRLSFYKGFSVLLEAMTRLPRARLALVGEGEERLALEADIRRLGLENRVLLAGETDEVETCLDACDLLMLPSLNRSEAFGLVLLEAMRAGRACIATRVPGSGMNEVVRHGENGLTVPPGDAPALARAVDELARDPERRKRMGRRGREIFHAAYDMRSVALALDEVYSHLL